MRILKSTLVGIVAGVLGIVAIPVGFVATVTVWNVLARAFGSKWHATFFLVRGPFLVPTPLLAVGGFCFVGGYIWMLRRLKPPRRPVTRGRSNFIFC